MADLAYAPNIPGQVGELYNAIGWFNFVSLTTAVNTPLVITLINGIKGGGSIQARFSLTRVGGGTGTVFVAQNPPLWTGAAFGNTAYKSIGQPVCLRDNSDFFPTFGQIVVDNLVILNKYGQPITDYAFYFTDSETPNAAQDQTFITNGSPWQIFYTMPVTSLPTAAIVGVGTFTVTTGPIAGNVPILVTRNPTSITQTLTGQGAMSFGVSITVAELTKVIVPQRIYPNDQFRLDITGPNSGTTITTGNNAGTQAQGLQVVSGLPGFFTFNESMAQGSTSNLSFYTQTIQLSNLTAGGTTLPSTLALGSGVTLNNGDYAVMTITNTAISSRLTMGKTVDKGFSELGETLTYTITVANPSPYSITNIIMTDTIPVNTTFITDSLIYNGVTQNGITPAPPTGFSIGTIAPGRTSTIIFKVLVTDTNSIPNPNRAVNSATATFSPTVNFSSVNTNSVVTTINDVLLSSAKTVSKDFAAVGDTITYTIVYSNTGNVSANNVVFIDTIPSGTTFITNSLKQNGVTISSSPNPPGVTLPQVLPPNSRTTITFGVIVSTIPNPNPIPNNASSRFTYTVDPASPNNRSSNSQSNTVTTKVNNANLGNVVKYVDKLHASCGEIINYTIVAPNIGNVTAENIVFKDTIPNGTILVSGSFKVNGNDISPVNLVSGVTIPNIAPGTTSTITFSVKVQC